MAASDSLGFSGCGVDRYVPRSCEKPPRRRANPQSCGICFHGSIQDCSWNWAVIFSPLCFILAVCDIGRFVRAAWYSATTLFFMVYPVLYVLAPEDSGSEAAAAGSSTAKAAVAS